MAVCYDPQALLRTASIGGLEFNCFRSEDTFGQRGPTHQYPDRQVPYSEFLGRKAEQHRVEGYFNGPDHVRQYHSLRAIANIPAPQSLVHPWLGNLSVKIVTLSVQHDQEEMLGETRFTLECVEAGSLSFPIGFAAFGAGVFSAVESIRTTVASTFEATFSIDTLPTYLAAESVQAASEAAEVVAGAFSGLIEWDEETIGIYDAVVALRDAPFNPVKPIAVVLQDAITSIGVDYREGTKDLAVSRLSAIARFRPTIETTLATGDIGDAVNRNINSVILATRLSAISELSRLVFEDDTYFKSYSASLAWVSETRELLAQELEIAVQDNCQDIFNVIVVLQNEISDTVDQLAPRLPSRQIVSTCHSLPSLLATYRAHGSIEKVCDLEAANSHASSWWMPPQLEVTS